MFSGDSTTGKIVFYAATATTWACITHEAWRLSRHRATVISKSLALVMLVIWSLICFNFAKGLEF